ncbi:hypothetical protein [Nocardia salmonicida]|uniref:hypothetical protein n=1 Tax=Nocardia salmonicida TaxID=53431 RepID=UPI0007A4CD8D|nr:hypothetical protein [Nocardia salmonicida]
MTTEPSLYHLGDPLRIMPRRTPESVLAVITFGDAAELGRRDARLPASQRTGYRRQDFVTATARHRMQEE